MNPRMVSNIIRFACIKLHLYRTLLFIFPVLLLIFLTFYAVVLVFDLLFAMFMVLGVSKVRSDFFFVAHPNVGCDCDTIELRLFVDFIIASARQDTFYRGSY